MLRCVFFSSFCCSCFLLLLLLQRAAAGCVCRRLLLLVVGDGSCCCCRLVGWLNGCWLVVVVDSLVDLWINPRAHTQKAKIYIKMEFHFIYRHMGWGTQHKLANIGALQQQQQEQNLNKFSTLYMYTHREMGIKRVKERERHIYMV